MAFGLLLPAQAAQQIVIIGDSLSKEYAYEGAFIGGSEAGPELRSWSEILHEKRNAYFDYGSSGTFTDLRLIGHTYNWSVPGSMADDWWNDYLMANTIQQFTYGIPTLEDQLESDAERIVIWIGGNELRAQYGNLYDGNLVPNTWAVDVFNDIEDVTNWVLDRKRSSAEVVLVNIPHLGACPNKNDAHPFNATKTGRVTSAVTNLNNRLLTFANTKGIGYADVYSQMLPLLTANHLCIGTVPIFRYPPREDGNVRYAFLGDGLHPNTPIQALFAQKIIDTFNSKYNRTFPRLTNTQILTEVLGVSPTALFDEWMATTSVPTNQRGQSDDPDKDGVKNMLEYCLEMDPSKNDLHKLPTPKMERISGQDYLSMTAKPKVEVCPSILLSTEQSNNLINWTPVPNSAFTTNPDGSITVRVLKAAGTPKLYLRLRATTISPG
jgi:hypothetical protein